MLIKKLHEDAVIPRYTTTGSVAFDVHALEDEFVLPNLGVYRIRTGVSFAVPEGYELSVRPRSGLSIKYPNYIANSPGTIDSDYRGEIIILVVNNSDVSWDIKKGDRIAQCALVPIERCFFEEVKELPETQRGSGRFGHTGIK